MELKQAVAIVTGSSSGIGAAIATQLAAKGCRVAINYNRNSQGAQAVAQACQDMGAEPLVWRADVAVDSDCRALVDATLKRFGRLDILVNNAGTTKFCGHQNLAGLSTEDFLNIYAVNTVGPFLMTRAAEQALRQQPVAHIVNMASIAAITGVGSSIAYAASKGALVTMTMSLARVLGPQIRVNAICPGFVAGEWLKNGLGESIYTAMQKHYMEISPLKNTATPETVAQTVLALVGGADWTTGETIIVDGGAHLHTAPMRR
ncbi:MAG: SDR family NAD(P)-dependent oxidoreductase [Desulfobacteraceae bacterium]|nr:SDR family NAD(P)-dependent oxidoreductase [Desulfobacteraceae bacterium]